MMEPLVQELKGQSMLMGQAGWGWEDRNNTVMGSGLPIQGWKAHRYQHSLRELAYSLVLQIILLFLDRVSP